MKSQISLSKEWSVLSKASHNKKFIVDLSNFLRIQGVKTILECGCGDGYVLSELAKRGFIGLGIDSDKELLEVAKKQNSNKNNSYKLMSWLDLDKIREKYDCVMCRGNSLCSVVSWSNDEIGIENARKYIIRSLELFFNRLKPNGLLYVDNISQKEINMGDNFKIPLIYPKIDIEAEITHNWKSRIRTTFGKGYVHGKYFEGGSSSYLLAPKELEELIQSLNPKEIFTPEKIRDNFYQIVCAKK
jgi:SAM-dependent methyltransferase